jgi:hypothetical protein
MGEHRWKRRECLSWTSYNTANALSNTLSCHKAQSAYKKKEGGACSPQGGCKGAVSRKALALSYTEDCTGPEPTNH